MFRFQHIDYLWLLLLLPLCILIYVYFLRWRRQKLRKIGDPALVQQMLKGQLPGRATTKFVLLAVALFLGIFGVANLQMGAQTEKVNRKGVDVFFALDVSKSMLATDVSPDRLTRAKQLINRMMDKMSNDRVGLIIFAGKAYLQVPMTVDYSAAKMLLSGVKPDMIPSQGTVLSEAIALARESFQTKDKKYKAVVLISDGEDHDEQALEEVQKAAEEGVVVYTVGIGSPEGSTLIDPETGTVKLDMQGQPVITKLNEGELKKIAQVSSGEYQLLTNTNKVADNLSSILANMEGRSLGSLVYTRYNSYFQYFLAAALVLLLIDHLIPQAGRHPYAQKKKEKRVK